MDQYYQDYADRIKFVELSDFIFHMAVTYSAMLDKHYQDMRAQNKKEEGFANIENSAAWLVEEILPVKFDDRRERYYVTTTADIFSFDFDGTGNALQGVCGLKNAAKKFRKISLNERRFEHISPVTNKVLYYLNSKNEIVFSGQVKVGDEIPVQYIPVVVGNDENCLLSDNIIGDVITKTLTIMFGAKNGNVIDESNDGNRNAVLQQQVNPQLTKTQQK